jgi:hypothetical protein
MTSCAVFIDPPGPIRPPHFATNALIQNGRVPLDPPPDREMVDGEAALRYDLLAIGTRPAGVSASSSPYQIRRLTRLRHIRN